MIPSHGISESTIAAINGVLARFPGLELAVLFGSRAQAIHKPGSDIDLALSGSGLDWRTVGRVYDALDDLLLPYRFSLIVHDRSTDAEVAAHIARVGVPIFERGAVAGRSWTSPPTPPAFQSPARS
ncbi:MAG: nucleotidyltransferase domain-containing protein [Undibacterium sp.]|nr:nucleotidyltransferase domain-containing protein [Opitutaceae bacterium]